MGMKMETDTPALDFFPRPCPGSLLFPGWPMSASLSFLSSSIIFYLFSHHDINSYFGFIGEGPILPHSPISLPSQAPFSFLVFMNIFIWTELRKTKLISPFSHPILSLQTPQSLNLGLLPPPAEHLYIVCLRFVPQ